MSEQRGCVEFLQRLIRTPSMPGEEGTIAALVAEEMRDVGFEEVEIDEAGNVIGRIRGQGRAPAVMLNTHLDHVDVGDPEAWPHPPFGGEIAESRVWGRGAADIKGPLAAQVYGAARVAEEGPPPGDVYVSAVVQEEVGGLGARYMASRLEPELVVIGEPSSNQLRRGHRGRVELVVHVRGRSAHASAPERGANPLAALGAFLAGLAGVELPGDPELGASTIAPTLIRTDQRSANVIPGEAWLTCDSRTVPGVGAADVRELLLPLLDESLVPDTEGEVEIPIYPRRSYTGFGMDYPAENHAFLLPADHPAVRTAAAVLRAPLGAEPPVGLWRFATDGGHFSHSGRTVIGFGPGEEALAHTVRESIAVAELEAAVAGYAALAREWPAAYAAEL
ncbi:MAG: M20/M25/M40 family metallo-hydrolase [Gemmatimonadota bacterium]